MADWIDRVTRLVSLAKRGVIVQVDRAADAYLPALLRRLCAHGPVHVCVDLEGLWAVPEGATVVLAPSPQHAAGLNASRPRVAARALRIVLWCSEAMSAALLRGAPDFFDWISHRVECSDRPLPPFVLAGMDAAKRAGVGGVVLEGLDDVEGAMADQADEGCCEFIAWNPSAMSVQTFGERGAGDRTVWVVTEAGARVTAPDLLRAVMALEGIDATVFVGVPGGSNIRTPGWWTLDCAWTPLPEAVAAVRAHVPKFPVDAVARCGGERGAIALLIALLECGASPGAIARGMRRSEDAGAWLARRGFQRGLVTADAVARGLASPPALRALWRARASREAARARRTKVAAALARGDPVPHDDLGWFASHHKLPSMEVRTDPFDEGSALYLLEAHLHAHPDGAPPTGRFVSRCIPYLPRMLVERLMMRWRDVWPEAEASQLFVAAMSEESSGDMNRAVDLYEGACDFARAHRRSELARAVIALARVHRLRGAYSAARTELEDLELAGESLQDPVGYFAERARLSIAWHRPGEAQSALNDLTRAGGPTELRRELRRELRAAILLLDGRYGEALTLLREEASLPAPRLLLRAEALLMAGAGESALETSLRAAELVPPMALTRAEARMLEARAWIELGNYAQAMVRTEEVANLWSRRSLDNPHLLGRWHRVRGEALLRSGHHEEAHEAFECAVRELGSYRDFRDHPEMLEARLAGLAVPGFASPAEVDAALGALRKRLRATHPVVTAWVRRTTSRMRAAG